jgi:hypothetical protein
MNAASPAKLITAVRSALFPSNRFPAPIHFSRETPIGQDQEMKGEKAKRIRVTRRLNRMKLPVDISLVLTIDERDAARAIAYK